MSESTTPGRPERRTGRRLLLGGGLAAMATGAALVPGRAEAASGTSPWLLGGNTGVATDGSNYLGIQNVAPLIFKTATTAGAPAERMRISSSGLVGIGTAAPVAKLDVLLANGTGVRGRTTGSATTSTGVIGSSVSGAGVVGQHNATTGAGPGVLGETNSTAFNAAGVLGRINDTTGAAQGIGVQGINTSTGGLGVGVQGTHAGGGYGVVGSSRFGVGVYGTSETFTAIYGSSTGSNTGVNGESESGPGVEGDSATGTGVIGRHNSGSGGDPGVLGETNAIQQNPVGVIGRVKDTNPGPSAGVHGINNGTGTSGVGVWGSHAGGGYGVYGTSVSGYAGFFDGNTHVNGTLSKSAGSFVIDHPLDPAAKTLTHSFVESDEMKNVYDGVVTTDKNGRAEVTLPDWFAALNRDYRYQLTPIGRAEVWIEREIADGAFVVGSAVPHAKVCWQVTGVRQDAYANAYRLPVESDKPADKRGTYLHPDLFGRGPEASASAGIAPTHTPHHDSSAPRRRTKPRHTADESRPS